MRADSPHKRPIRHNVPVSDVPNTPGVPPGNLRRTAYAGDLDTLATVEEARRFVAALRAVSRNPVADAEIPGAQHAFELFSSLRSMLVVHGVERFVAYLYSQYLAARRSLVDDSTGSGRIVQRFAVGEFIGPGSP